MELKAHDIVRIRHVDRINFRDTKPDWAFEALLRAPFAVIRRAPLVNAMVPVGIRGGNRNQRIGGYIDSGNTEWCIAPEELALRKSWRENRHLEELRITDALELIDKLMTSEGYVWGPAGSIGFELATRVSVATESSDLDIMIRSPDAISLSTARKLLDKLKEVPVKTDVQLEMQEGGIALVEYAQGKNPVLLRTINGPCLIRDPWNERVVRRF